MKKLQLIEISTSVQDFPYEKIVRISLLFGSKTICFGAVIFSFAFGNFNLLFLCEFLTDSNNFWFGIKLNFWSLVFWSFLVSSATIKINIYCYNCVDLSFTLVIFNQLFLYEFLTDFDNFWFGIKLYLCSFVFWSFFGLLCYN